MKASELRIGNYVEYKYLQAEYVEVSGVDTEHIYLSDIVVYDYLGHDDIEPIPLTEEWLLDLGFVSNPYADMYEKNTFHLHCDKTKGSLGLWMVHLRVELKHVHQLQNLYFALTGKELTLTKNK